MRSFITGSHAYGTPSHNSDVDLVILGSKQLIDELRKLTGIKAGEPLKFRDLNLVICETETEMAVWKIGTQHLKINKRGKGFNKKIAKTTLDHLRDMVGIEDKAYLPRRRK